MNTSTNFLTEWGQSQRQMPEHNQDIKGRVMAEFAHMPKTDKKSFSFKLPVFAFSAAALVVLMVVFYNGSFKSEVPSQTTTSYLLEDQTAAMPPAGSSMPSSLAGLSANESDMYYGDVSSKSMRADSPYGKEGVFNSPAPQNLSGEVSIKDDRQFLKMSYSASINSLHVQDLTTNISNIIKGSDGRIDYLTASQESSQINFVIPQSHFEAFKEQVKNTAGARFYIETTSAQNQLSQKQYIEQKAKSVDEQLADYKDQQKKVTEDHTKTVSSLNGQISALNKQLAQVKESLNQNPMNADLQNQSANLTAQISKLKSSLAYENTNFQNQMDYYEANIQDLNKYGEQVKQEDENLVDSVATVTGHIVIYKINWLQYINTYFPFYLSIPLLLIIALAIFFVRVRKPIIIP